jgi:lipopolysaccharide/colanic/teichoic acid biosynthesis glycosyltransferase
MISPIVRPDKSAGAPARNGVCLPTVEPDGHAVVVEMCGPEGQAASPGWYQSCKHAMDWLCALVLLVLTAPLILAAMGLVKASSRGPVLYSQTRLGRHGKPFTIYKLRTMYAECESLTGACWSKPGDTRITPVGRWLRRTHLDELPQLFNVLLGDMSLIGPRPERPEFVPTLEQAIAHYSDRLLLRPGITGLAQVQLPPDTDLASVAIKTAYDLYYVQHVAFWLDCRIAVVTLLKMFGVRFGALQWLCRLPVRTDVEEPYRRLAAGPRPEFNAVVHAPAPTLSVVEL